MRPENLLERPLPAKKCTTGCPILDRFLAGGIPCGSVTEIVGESGSGKTQLSLQLLLSAQLPLSLGGLSSSSLYLHSEFPYPFRRFQQLSTEFYSLHSEHFQSVEYICNNVLVQALHSADHLFDVLLRLDLMLADHRKIVPIKLIVIDSIAALFRSEFENTPSDLKRRSGLFFKISSKLKSQAYKYGIAVLVTNQVVDVMRSSEDMNGIKIGNLDYLYTSGRRVCPALGISWANCVNSRLFLSMNEQMVVSFIFCRTVKCKPFLLFCKASSVAANMNLLQTVGVPQTLIFQIMKQIHAPTCNDVFSTAVLKVKDMGFDPKSWSFVHALIVMIFCNNDLLRGTKADMYRSFGFSDDDMLFMFKKQPISFTCNAVRNMKAVDFCLNKLCWSPSQLAASPNVFVYSLEKRTVPRCSVLQVLVSRNMITKSFSLLSVLGMTETEFLKKYALKHQKEVPEVMDAYQGTNHTKRRMG